MRAVALCIVLCVLAGSVASAAPLQKLALQWAVRANPSPVLDGELDDACWKTAPAFTDYVRIYGDYYQDIALRAVWDDAGLYLGVTNHERHLERLKVNIRLREGGYVFEDDCAEFYIDPSGTGYSMFKFDISSIGVISDFWQVDMSNTDTSWAAASARAVCGRTTEAWTMEFFVSWADLKTTVQPGDIWKFIHQRFSYTAEDGRRCAMSTSGGNFWNQRFGYMYFVDQALPPPQQVGQQLLKLSTQPWVLSLNGSWLYARDDRVEELPDTTILERLRVEARVALEGVAEVLKRAPNSTSQAQYTTLHKRFESAPEQEKPGELFPAMAEYSAIAGAASDLKDDALLVELIAKLSQATAQEGTP